MIFPGSLVIYKTTQAFNKRADVLEVDCQCNVINVTLITAYIIRIRRIGYNTI